MKVTHLKKKFSGFSHSLHLESLISLSGRRLILPFYHTISDIDLAHIKHLYPVLSSKRFKADIDFFQKNYTPLSLEVLKTNIKNNVAFEKNSFYITFDDGLREFYDTVAPILYEQGITATCFLNSGFVDNKDMFFRMKASVLLEKIKNSPLSNGETKAMIEAFDQYGLKYEYPQDLLNISDRNKGLINIVSDILEFDVTDYLAKNKPYLSTDQINELRQKGFTFGAHSVTHPLYENLTEKQQLTETLECLEYLKNSLGISDRLFAFPYTDYGVNTSFFEKIAHHVDISFGTANLKQDIIKTNLQRIPMEVFDYNSAEEIIKPEYFYFILKKMIGRHVIQRQ